jgi:hypothetical protein
MQSLLEQRWTPIGVNLPETSFTPEVIARIIRITSGNLRLLTRLLTQIERVSSSTTRRLFLSKSSEPLNFSMEGGEISATATTSTTTGCSSLSAMTGAKASNSRHGAGSSTSKDF